MEEMMTLVLTASPRHAQTGSKRSLMSFDKDQGAGEPQWRPMQHGWARGRSKATSKHACCMDRCGFGDAPPFGRTSGRKKGKEERSEEWQVSPLQKKSARDRYGSDTSFGMDVAAAIGEWVYKTICTVFFLCLNVEMGAPSAFLLCAPLLILASIGF